MKQFIKKTIFICCLLLTMNAVGQVKTDFPTIGKPMPMFNLHDVNFYAAKRLNNEALKGKWYVLDFWIKSCSPCIESFPKISNMVKEFKNKVEIIGIGIGGDELKDFYEKLRKKNNLEIPMAFDPNLAKNWSIHSYPLIFIVDDRGILRAITNEINSEKLTALVSENRNTFGTLDKYKKYIETDNIEKLYFVNGNGGNDTSFLFRSVLAKSTPDHPRDGIADLNTNDTNMVSVSNLKKGFFQLSNASLLMLYNVAYFGQDRFMPLDSLYSTHRWFSTYSKKTWVLPILEVKDSTDFLINEKLVKGLYTYSLSIPKEKASKEFMMKTMRLDLLKNFGYHVSIESRIMPIWQLKIIDKELVNKIKTQGGIQGSVKNESGGYNFTNTPMLSVITRLWGMNQLEGTFINDTGILFNIDLKIDASFKDLSQVSQELRKNGLDLVKAEKSMKVLVIRDPKRDLER